MSEVTVVSNRLPITLEQGGEDWKVTPSSGGLVSAMRPILEQRGGRWIGWPGVTGENGWGSRLEVYANQQPYDLVPVPQTEEEFRGFYAGFTNSVLWPLFHGFSERCEFQQDYWETYQQVNQKFAETVEQNTSSSSVLWIHDYHLMLVAQMLGDQVKNGKTGFFLHIPFPDPGQFARLPWRKQILEGLLAYDVVGFQSQRDLKNFQGAVERFAPVASGCRADVYPIGIDFEDFETRAACASSTAGLSKLRDKIGDYDVLLGVDRLDYTKGLLKRLRAYERALEKYPDLHERVVLYSLVVPSRESVREYQQLKRELDRLVGRIVGRFSTSEWTPVQYRYDSVSMLELTALYRYADTAVVTPLCDGQNLVAKEYCAAQVDETGVLLLSEFAGAADQLGDDAVLVNPYDKEGLANALHQAVTMSRSERVDRMRRLRRNVKKEDVYWWAKKFLSHLTE